MKTEPTVYVVDDDESIRELLTWLIRRENLRAESFADARSFLTQYRPEHPGCLVLDLNLPGMSGLDLQSYLNERGVLLPVVFVSGYADVPKAVRAVKSGAVDFIEKPFDYKRIIAVIHDCLARDAETRAARGRATGSDEHLAALSPREREVLALIVDGKLNREIAEQLAISIKTVEVHRAHIMEKLGARSLAQLVQISMGLVSAGGRDAAMQHEK